MEYKSFSDMDTNSLLLAWRWLGEQKIEDTEYMINKYEMTIDIEETEEALLELFTEVESELKKRGRL